MCIRDSFIRAQSVLRAPLSQSELFLQTKGRIWGGHPCPFHTKYTYSLQSALRLALKSSGTGATRDTLMDLGRLASRAFRSFRGSQGAAISKDITLSLIHI